MDFNVSSPLEILFISQSNTLTDHPKEHLEVGSMFNVQCYKLLSQYRIVRVLEKRVCV